MRWIFSFIYQKIAFVWRGDLFSEKLRYFTRQKNKCKKKQVCPANYSKEEKYFATKKWRFTTMLSKLIAKVSNKHFFFL